MGPLLQTTNPKNYATYIPLIFIFALIFLLIFSIFKRNKLIFIFFIVLIFFDLRSIGNYIEGSSDASYIKKDLKRYEEFSFIKSETQPYRFYPVVDWGPEGATIYPNRNIHYKTDLVSGLDPLMLGDYSFFMGMFYMDNKEKAEMLMRNNNILSMLNTKYIIYFKPDNYDVFKQNITKVFYKDNGSIINSVKFNSAILKSALIKDEDTIVLKSDSGNLKYFKIPAKIEENNSYLVSFEIKENIPKDSKSLLNNKIFVDFFAEGYDSAEQEFLLNPEDISADFKTIRKVILSGEAPADKEIYFRVFTHSDREIEIQNLKLNEVSVYEYNNIIV